MLPFFICFLWFLLTIYIIYANILLYMKEKIAIYGDGGWGTTLAIVLFKAGHDVTLWGAFPEYIKFLENKRRNKKFLPGIDLPKGIRLTSDIAEISKDALAVIAIPSKYLRKTLPDLKSGIGKRVVSLTKGIEGDTLLRPSEVMREVLQVEKVASLSGPTISFEVARDLPATCVVASLDEVFTKELQVIFTTPNFRVYTSNDLVGVELGGALKNVVAIAAGISDGLGFGVNTKAAILTRGLVEIVRLGEKMGALKNTFFGLSGLGDLATTCMSEHSRNRTLGEKIGRGKKLEEILKESQMIAEGVTTAKSAYELSKKYDVDMPIVEKIYEVLYKNKEPKKAVKELMSRAFKAEAI